MFLLNEISENRRVFYFDDTFCFLKLLSTTQTVHMNTCTGGTPIQTGSEHVCIHYGT